MKTSVGWEDPKKHSDECLLDFTKVMTSKRVNFKRVSGAERESRKVEEIFS